jgi:HNH endonuclease
VAVSKRLRYEVLRRDNFACRYCGTKPPEAELQVDAVVPEALGGSHKDPANLVTACEPCNSGKSSSSPDAPVVAAVAEDAIRWSLAIRQAQAAMLAERDARAKDHAKFGEWWDAWGIGDGEHRQPVPRDPAWWVTVDQLLAAGLPLIVLKDCIDLAMSRRGVTPENTFRYMCGIAWNMTRKIQDNARREASGTAAESAPDAALDPYEQGRLDFARELLGGLSEEGRSYFLDEADLSDCQEEGNPPQTEAEHACFAVEIALSSVRCDWDWLARKAEEHLRGLPGGIGERALLTAAENQLAIGGPDSRRTFLLTDALAAAEDLLHLPAAAKLLGAMPEQEQAEWRALARALYDRANLDDDRLTSRAAFCAEVVLAGGHWPAMCCMPGEHIPACPQRATHHARIAEAECCGPDGLEDHKGHPLCDRHLKELIAGTLVSRKGNTCSVKDYVAISSDPWDF